MVFVAIIVTWFLRDYLTVNELLLIATLLITTEINVSGYQIRYGVKDKEDNEWY